MSYHHGDLPSALKQAVLRLLERGGLEAVSMRAVAREAGVSHAAPAHHFTDVDDLLNAVAVDGFKQLSEHVNWQQRMATEPWERLRAYGIAYVEFAMENSAGFSVMFRNNPSTGGPFAEQKHSVGREAMERLRMNIADCAPRRDWREDEITQLALLAWCAVHGCAVLQLSGAMAAASPSHDLSRNVADEVTAIFADLLKSFVHD